MNDPLVRPSDVCKLVGLPLSWIYSWVGEGFVPCSVKLSEPLRPLAAGRSEGVDREPETKKLRPVTGVFWEAGFSGEPPGPWPNRLAGKLTRPGRCDRRRDDMPIIIGVISLNAYYFGQTR